MTDNNESWINSGGGVCADCGPMRGFTHAPDCPTKLPRERAATASGEPRQYPPNAWHNPTPDDEPRKAPSCSACGAIVGNFHAKGCATMERLGRETDIRNALDRLLTRKNEPVLLAVLSEVVRQEVDVWNEDTDTHVRRAAVAMRDALRYSHLTERPRQGSNLRPDA